MIRRKLASVIVAALVIVTLAQVAVNAATLKDLKVTPGTATANSIYTFEVVYEDKEDKYPAGEPVVLKAEPGVAYTKELERASPVHLYGAPFYGENEESAEVEDAGGVLRVPVINVPLRGVMGVWERRGDLPSATAPIGNIENNLALPAPDNIFHDQGPNKWYILLDPAKITQDLSTQPLTVYVVYYAQKGTLNRIHLSDVPAEIKGVWNNDQGTGQDYYKPAPPGRIEYFSADDGKICMADVILGTPYPDANPDDVLYVTYGVMSTRSVRFKTFWPFYSTAITGVVNNDDAKDLVTDKIIATGPDEDGYYTIALGEDLNCWPQKGVNIRLNYKGYRRIEPIKCIRPEKPTSADPYRTDKIAYLGSSRKYADETGAAMGQVPLLRQGLLGVYDSPDLSTPGLTNYATMYNRYTGKVYLSDDTEYGRVYWAVYMVGPVWLNVMGKTLYMAEKDDISAPNPGLTYYVRASAGLDLINKSNGVPGVNLHSGLIWDGKTPPEIHKMKAFTIAPPEGTGEPQILEVETDEPTIWDSTASVMPGYFTEHEVDDLQGKRVVVPFTVSNYSSDGVDGIFAFAVDWNNNGRVKIDYTTNYWTGGTYQNDAGRVRCTITPGTDIVRWERIPVTSTPVGGTTVITLPLGYADVIKSASHFMGVYLEKNGKLNYFAGGTYTQGDLWSYMEPVIKLGTPLPANVDKVWIRYVPRVMVQAKPSEIEQLYPTSTVATNPLDYKFTMSPVQGRFGGITIGEDMLISTGSGYEGGILPLDPLVPELPTTTAGRLPVPDPANPGQTLILRKNVLDPQNPVMDPENTGENVDNGTSSSAFVFRVLYANNANLPPRAWLPQYAAPSGAPPYSEAMHTGGVIMYLDEKGYGDYKPYFMAKMDAKDHKYDDGDGCIYVFRVEPAEGVSSWYHGENEYIPRSFMLFNIYRSLLMGQYHYFFGASDDYIKDQDGNLYPNERVWIQRDPLNVWSYLDYDNWDWWTEASPYDPMLRTGTRTREGRTYEGEMNMYNGYVYVDRYTYSPGNVDLYGHVTANGKDKGLLNSSEHPIVDPQLEPPVELSFYDTAAGKLEGGPYFLGTIYPYYRASNPTYAFPTHGITHGYVHHHIGYYVDISGIWGGAGTPTTGSTTATEHTFSIKYKSRSGRAPSGGVWVYINNASSAGNAGRVKISEVPNGKPANPYVYVGYPMQPAEERPDYSKGAIFVLRNMTLPTGPHTYYFEAMDNAGVVRYPVRPDGRWHSGTNPATGKETFIYHEDAWVPGDQDYADNNDFCPGPYVNNKPRLSNHSVSPSSGGQSTDFTFTVTYSDDDGDVDNIKTIDPGYIWNGPDYKGQRPYQAVLVIDNENNRVQMTKLQPSDVNYKDGAVYTYTAHLPAGEHRYYFEFIDDWGYIDNPNDIVPGEKVRYPEGENTWINGPVVAATTIPTLSDGTVESADGTSNSATLWTLGVTYADGDKEEPTYVNLYVGEESTRLTRLERASVKKDAAGNANSIVVANCNIKKVVGIYDNPEGSGVNLLETNVGTVDPNLTGVIKLETPLATDNDVYVTYYYNDLQWDEGYAMSKANPDDNVYTDGVRYETNLRLGGAIKQMLEPSEAAVSADSQGRLMLINVDPNIVGSIKSIYDNKDLDGIDYWTGKSVNEQCQLQTFDAATGKATIRVAHAPIAPEAAVSVYGSPLGQGVNYFASIKDAAAGTIELKGIPAADGSQNPSLTTVFVSYSTGQARYDQATGTVMLTTPFPAGALPYIFYGTMPRAYHFAYEASDRSNNMAVYNTAVDTVTLQDSIWAGASNNKSYVSKEDLTPVVPGRQFRPSPKNMWRNGQWVQFDPILIGHKPDRNVVELGSKLTSPVLYKNSVRLIEQYENIAELRDTKDSTGNTIQLDPLSVSEKAWRIDSTHVQLRMSPIPDPVRANISPNIRVVDISDGTTTYYQSDGDVDVNTGILTLTTSATPLNPVPESEPTVLASYTIWGVTDSTATVIHGVSDILGIYENREGTGFDYWLGKAKGESHVVERLAGSVTRIKVDHPNLRDVEGVWDNSSLTGANYLDRFDSKEGMVWLKNVPANVSNVYVSYTTEPAVYDRGLGKITLGSPLADGVRSVWIKYRQSADYKVNLLGDRYASEPVPGTFIFNYDVPYAADAATAWAGPIKADYWFGRILQDRSGNELGLGNNTAPRLTNGKLSPVYGDSKTEFTFTVDYTDTDGPNGQAPAYVRVVIDGVQHDMQPVVQGTPAYNAGATYKYTTSLSTGAHGYHFEASDGEEFAFYGGYGSTPVKIVDIPGPWVDDPPVLSDGKANPNPTDTALSIFDSVDFQVTYTDKDNTPPDAGTPVVWINADKLNNTAHVAVVDEIIGQDGTASSVARKIRFDRKLHDTVAEESDPLVRAETAVRWDADQFAGAYLQIVQGRAVGRVYQIAYNGRDTITVLSDNIRDMVEVGDKFVIGPIRMLKEADPTGQKNFAGGIIYRVTVPRLAEDADGFQYHFEASSTTRIPDDVANTVPIPEDQRWFRTVARFPETGELQGAKVVVNVPASDTAPELLQPKVTPPDNPSADAKWTFEVTYKDVNNDPPYWRQDVPMLGYVRFVFDDKSFAEDLLPVDGSTDYRNGVKFRLETNKVTAGTHTGRFIASDGWKTAQSEQFTVIINSRPEFSDLKVTPPSGNMMAQFTFSAILTDDDGDIPRQVGLTIYDPLNESMKYDVPANQITKTLGSYRTGVTYSWTVRPAERPEVFAERSESYVYAYRWTARDAYDASEPAVGSGPTINPNTNRPQLRFPIDGGALAPVTPDKGNANTNYRFQVIYSDADGDGPLVEYPAGSNKLVEGVLLTIDPSYKTPLTLLLSRQTSTPDYKAGVTYSAVVPGNNLPRINADANPTGLHKLMFKATDGKMIPADWIVTITADGPEVSQSSVSLTPDHWDPVAKEAIYSLGERAVITGTLTPWDSSASKDVSVTVKRPDGTGWTQAIKLTDQSAGRFNIEFDPLPGVDDRMTRSRVKVLDMTKNWTITAKWAGTPSSGEASRSMSLAVKCPEPYQYYELQTSAGGKEMISSPLYWPAGATLDAIWGGSATSNIEMSRYDPDLGQWIIKGQGYFPLFKGGEGYRIIPSATFPVDPIVNRRILQPYGKLWYQNEPFAVTLKPGWNIVGSVFLKPILWGDVQISYQGATKSLNEAATAGLVKNFAWTWDVVAQEYKLIDATKAGAIRTLVPYKAYWVFSNADCQLILNAGSGAAAASSRSVPAAAGTAVDPRESSVTLDTPPAQ